MHAVFHKKVVSCNKHTYLDALIKERENVDAVLVPSTFHEYLQIVASMTITSPPGGAVVCVYKQLQCLVEGATCVLWTATAPRSVCAPLGTGDDRLLPSGLSLVLHL